jgi:hypothetical protein
MVRECLMKMNARADCMVISQTPVEALEREWAENDIAGNVRLIAGQEMGTKADHLKFATEGKYKPANVLMIGDAPGDHQAAAANDALFFPINPGNEEASWGRLHDEGLDNFFNGAFAGDYQRKLVDEFESCLPEAPPWGG